MKCFVTEKMRHLNLQSTDFNVEAASLPLASNS